MRLMARAAHHPAGVIGGHHLRETLGFRGVLFMTARTENGHVGQRGFDVDEVGRVPGLRPMAGFAGDMSVFAGGARLGLLIMAGDALGLPTKADRMLANQAESRRPVVAVCAEILGDHSPSNHQEQSQSHHQNQGGAGEMSGIAKEAVHDLARKVQDGYQTGGVPWEPPVELLDRLLINVFSTG